MNKERLKQLQKEWYEENYPTGKALGYPDCCIKEFCNQPPEYLKSRSGPTKDDILRYKMSFLNGESTRFFPCTNHAKQIKKGLITIDSLIQNRDKDLPPFPHF